MMSHSIPIELDAAWQAQNTQLADAILSALRERPIMAALTRAAVTIRRNANRAAILAYVTANPGCTADAIASGLRSEHSSVVGHLRHLKKSGHPDMRVPRAARVLAGGMKRCATCGGPLNRGGRHSEHATTCRVCITAREFVGWRYEARLRLTPAQRHAKYLRSKLSAWNRTKGG